MNIETIAVSRIPATRRHVKRHRWAATRRLSGHAWELAYGRTRHSAISNLRHHRQK